MKTRAQQTELLDAAVSEVRFVHGKRKEGLAELGVHTIRELFGHFPFRYDDFSKIVPIAELRIGERSAVIGRVLDTKNRKTSKGGQLFEIGLADGTGVLKVVWFNQRWLPNTITPGKHIMVLGAVEHYNGYLSMASPQYVLVSTEQKPAGASEDESQNWGVAEEVNPVGIVGVYHANALVSSNWIKRIVLEAHKLVPAPLDPLPPALRVRRRLVSRQKAWHDIHMPHTNTQLEAARYRLAYEQVFMVQLHLALEDNQQKRSGSPCTQSVTNTHFARLAQVLPFELTHTQREAVAQIREDLAAPRRMNRLLIGDVGSGKTVVALHALAIAALSGKQAVVMAPTEVLARQYTASVGSYLDALGISWTLLVSAVSAAERAQALEQLANGTVSVAFGTHALIEDRVQFARLSLIVIDEQHRFGVRHREALIQKNPQADFLAMTATPIPRSLALVLYGRVQTSYLAPFLHKARTTTTRLDARHCGKAYDAIEAACARGEQAYIVCPLISAPSPAAQGAGAHGAEELEECYLDDLATFSDEGSAAAAEDELRLLREQVFPTRRIELMTSRLSPQEKQRVMAAFRAGEVDILVSTTVIEVGVDVPNATVMLIHDANHFGLAQLHQLRGRVGRGSADAQVFLITRNAGKAADARLALLEHESDGLKLAEADLALRREGDLAGTRQHGQTSLSLINVVRDRALIEAAHEDVELLLATDPTLDAPQHGHLRFELAALAAHETLQEN